MHFFLLYTQFFSPKDKNVRRLGGLETYMEYLSLLLLKMGHQPVICQYADSPFRKTYQGFEVRGYPVRSAKALYHQVKPELGQEDVVIFMSDRDSYSTGRTRDLSIQHGIWWDIPYEKGLHFINVLKRFKARLRGIRDFRRCPHKVCVDYNFYNWYKTYTVTNDAQEIVVIPNFAIRTLSEQEETVRAHSEPGRARIVFARRFDRPRGATLFAKVMNKIMKKYPHVTLTLAGEGSLKEDLRCILAPFADRVRFTSYLPHESFEFHMQHDIAVIPSTSSEGTSLSLLEAMGAGCLVVTTPVGGLSNIVIDEYNGYLAMPEEQSLEIAIEKAILNNTQELQRNAVETVRKGFSLEMWEERWRNVIERLLALP